MEHKGIILLVEDNADLNDSNSRALRLQGYEVMAALTLHAARERLAQQEPDIILLDVMLPDGDGFDFCAEIRDKISAHILFLTAKTEQEDMVRGLTGGGDDYITKPFRLSELLARIDAVMRRRRMDKTAALTLRKGALALDTVACQAYFDGRDLLLSLKEFAVLLRLAQNEGDTLSAEFLYKNVWGQPLAGDASALHTVIYRLRKKLVNTGYDIRLRRGQGYIFSGIYF